MIDSLKFEQFEKNTNNTEFNTVSNSNQEAIKKIFENNEG
jgi:hypothetical protein